MRRRRFRQAEADGVVSVELQGDADADRALAQVAQAASEGRLDAARLRELGPERAFEDVTQLKGIGPFYGTLIVVRATGFADALLPAAEPRVLSQAARVYGLPAPPSLDEFARLAEPWPPFRTWATVLLRRAGERGTA